VKTPVAGNERVAVDSRDVIRGGKNVLAIGNFPSRRLYLFPLTIFYS
jgi:hypothetical protein